MKFKHHAIFIATAFLAFSFCFIERGLAQQLHVLIAADARAGLPGFDTTVNNLTHLLQSAKSAEIALRVVSVPKHDISPDSILAEIRALKDSVKPTDSFLFYYIGHGGTDRRVGHVLTTTGGDLLRAEVRVAAEQLSASSISIMTDCCGVEIQAAEGIAAPALTPKGRELFKRLFIRKAGIVDITAATFDPIVEGTGKAFYTGRNGGMFTESFAMTLYDADRLYSQYGENIFQWNCYFSVLRDDVNKKYKDFRSTAISRGSRNQDLLQTMEQIPHAFQLGEVMPPVDAIVTTTNRPGKPPRFGAVLHTGYGFGLIVNRTLDGGAAERILVARSESGKETLSVERMLPGDTISFANGRPLKTISDFYEVIDSVPTGGVLSFEGADKSTGYRTSYRATAVLP